MRLIDLLDLADEGYPDGFLSHFYDERGDRVGGSGDTLARFVVAELSETFDPDAPDAEQLDSARAHIRRAIDALDSVAERLNLREGRRRA